MPCSRKEAVMEHVEGWPNLVKLSESEDLLLEEPWQDIRGLDVVDVNGDEIGSVEDLYVDDREEDRVVVNRHRDKVIGSPDFEAEEVPNYDFQRAIRAYYGHI